MLLANNIFFERDNQIILKNLSLTISEKKIIHLIGKNGSGKTTLLKILSNILYPQKGDIFWNGKNIKKNPFEFYKDITFIMDKESSNKNLTLYENIFFWKKIFSSKINESEIDSILSVLSLIEYKNTRVINLSYGEIKKLELLRLIIEKKKLWLLDEPFIGLDKTSIEIINQTIINHTDLGGMVVFTSHISSKISNLEILEL